jgi:hypothetical protein
MTTFPLLNQENPHFKTELKRLSHFDTIEAKLNELTTNLENYFNEMNYIRNQLSSIIPYDFPIQYGLLADYEIIIKCFSDIILETPDLNHKAQIEKLNSLNKIDDTAKSIKNEKLEIKRDICTAYLEFYQMELFDKLRICFTNQIHDTLKKFYIDLKLGEKKPKNYNTYFNEKTKHKFVIIEKLLLNNCKFKVNKNSLRFIQSSNQEFKNIIFKAQNDPHQILELTMQESTLIVYKWEQMIHEMKQTKSCESSETINYFEKESNLTKYFNISDENRMLSHDIRKVHKFLNKYKNSSFLDIIRYGLDNLIKGYKSYLLALMFIDAFQRTIDYRPPDHVSLPKLSNRQPRSKSYDKVLNSQQRAKNAELQKAESQKSLNDDRLDSRTYTKFNGTSKRIEINEANAFPFVKKNTNPEPNNIDKNISNQSYTKFLVLIKKKEDTRKKQNNF